MRILYACHRFPFPPKRGGKIRPFNMIRHLTECGHEVTVASLARDAAELADGADLRRYCHDAIGEVVGTPAAVVRMVARVPTAEPSSFGYFWSPALARRIRAELANRSYDLGFVHCSSAAPYLAEATGLPRLLDFGDMDSQKWREYANERAFPASFVYGVEARKLERAERRLAAAFDFSTCTTRAELETLRALAPDVRSDWFPNGVDAEFFAPGTEAYDPRRVCFVGRMDYYPNQEAVLRFVRDAWPGLRRRVPGIRFTVIGASPSAQIRALGGRDDVEVTGTVDDVRPLARAAAVSIAPLAIARGTQNKILESMAMGVPVVCSRIASKGVDAVPGEHLRVADSAEELVEAVADLVERPEERARLAEAGRARVLERHRWAASMARMEALARGVAGGVRGA